jgi:DhnA family fructose-bisphosphate aldolase class Ia
MSRDRAADFKSAFCANRQGVLIIGGGRAGSEANVSAATMAGAAGRVFVRSYQ